jgi:hypothetical protein
MRRRILANRTAALLPRPARTPRIGRGARSGANLGRRARRRQAGRRHGRHGKRGPARPDAVRGRRGDAEGCRGKGPASPSRRRPPRSSRGTAVLDHPTRRDRRGGRQSGGLRRLAPGIGHDRRCAPGRRRRGRHDRLTLETLAFAWYRLHAQECPRQCRTGRNTGSGADLLRRGAHRIPDDRCEANVTASPSPAPPDGPGSGLPVPSQSRDGACGVSTACSRNSIRLGEAGVGTEAADQPPIIDTDGGRRWAHGDRPRRGAWSTPAGDV